MAAFLSTSFSTDAFSVLAFDFGDVPDDAQSKGGVDEHRRYRKYLERLEEITRTKEITPEQITEVREIAEEITVQAPVIAVATKTDYSFVADEITAIVAKLEQMLYYNIELERRRKRKDDELALLLLVM